MAKQKYKEVHLDKEGAKALENILSAANTAITKKKRRPAAKKKKA